MREEFLFGDAGYLQRVAAEAEGRKLRFCRCRSGHSPVGPVLSVDAECSVPGWTWRKYTSLWRLLVAVPASGVQRSCVVGSAAPVQGLGYARWCRYSLLIPGPVCVVFSARRTHGKEEPQGLRRLCMHRTWRWCTIVVERELLVSGMAATACRSRYRTVAERNCGRRPGKGTQVRTSSRSKSVR